MKAARKPERDAELVEFSLVDDPHVQRPVPGPRFFLLFARATLQYAVREGVRCAVTGHTMSGMGQDANLAPTSSKAGGNFCRWAGLAIEQIRRWAGHSGVGHLQRGIQPGLRSGDQRRAACDSY